MDSKNNSQSPTTEGDLELARRIASIIGPSSAAARAIADYERFLAKGEDPIVLLSGGNSWVVVPRSILKEGMGS